MSKPAKPCKRVLVKVRSEIYEDSPNSDIGFQTTFLDKKNPKKKTFFRNSEKLVLKEDIKTCWRNRCELIWNREFCFEQSHHILSKLKLAKREIKHYGGTLYQGSTVYYIQKWFLFTHHVEHRVVQRAVCPHPKKHTLASRGNVLGDPGIKVGRAGHVPAFLPTS